MRTIFYMRVLSQETSISLNMQWLLSALCVVLSKAAVDAQVLSKLINGDRVSLGPVNAHISVGKLPPKYPTLRNIDINASKKIVGYIEFLRKYFEFGTDILPPLEPYVKTEIEAFNVQTELLNGRIALRDITLSGLKKFNMNNLETRLNGYRLDFNVSLPVLQVDVEYVADTTLSGVLPLSFAGHVNAEVVGMNLNGAARFDAVRYLDKTVFQVRALDIRASAVDIEGEVSGLDMGDVAADVLDKDQLGSNNPLIQAVKQNLAESIAKVVAQEINEVLLNQSASDILKFLYSTGKQANF